LKFAAVPIPEPKPGQVVIKVLAAGVNRLEHYLREGSVLRNLVWSHIRCSDAAGEIVRVGPGVQDFKIGEIVIPMPGYPLDQRDYRFVPMCAAPSYAIRFIAPTLCGMAERYRAAVFDC
jgi:NADPH:quinone reductase